MRDAGQSRHSLDATPLEVLPDGHQWRGRLQSRLGGKSGKWNSESGNAGEGEITKYKADLVAKQLLDLF